MNFPAQWVFFDLGGTLIDESRPIANRIDAIVETLRTRGYTLSHEDLDTALIQASTEFAPRIIKRALELLEIDSVLGEGFASAIYRKDLEEPYPDAMDTIRRLSKSFNLGVIANQSAGTRDRLQAYGLLEYFMVVVASTEEGVSKPSQAIFELAATRADCEPQDAIMVGDRLDNDIAPAKAAGFHTIRVLRGYARFQEPRSVAETPDYTVKDLVEIPVLLNA